jgi:hypothetical protein
MACDKTKMNCVGAKQFATCVRTEVEPPAFSNLGEENCLSVEEVLEDLYQISGDIKTEIDLSTITSTCLSLPINKTIKNLIQQLYTEICALKTITTNQTTLIATQQLEIIALQNNTCP